MKKFLLALALSCLLSSTGFAANWISVGGPLNGTDCYIDESSIRYVKSSSDKDPASATFEGKVIMLPEGNILLINMTINRVKQTFISHSFYFYDANGNLLSSGEFPFDREDPVKSSDSIVGRYYKFLFK